MAGSGARKRRQEKRAALLNRGLVSKEDLQAVIGMTLQTAQEFAGKKNLRVRVYVENKEDKTKDSGPDAIVVKLIDGIIVNAKTNRIFND